MAKDDLWMRTYFGSGWSTSACSASLNVRTADSVGSGPRVAEYDKKLYVFYRPADTSKPIQYLTVDFDISDVDGKMLWHITEPRNAISLGSGGPPYYVGNSTPTPFNSQLPLYQSLDDATTAPIGPFFVYYLDTTKSPNGVYRAHWDSAKREFVSPVVIGGGAATKFQEGSLEIAETELAVYAYASQIDADSIVTNATDLRSQDVYPGPEIVPKMAASHSPTAIYYDELIHLFSNPPWGRGSDGYHTTLDGVSWSDPVKLPSSDIWSSPGAAIYHNVLYLAWLGGYNYPWYMTYDGIGYGTPRQLPDNDPEFHAGKTVGRPELRAFTARNCLTMTYQST